MKNWKTTVAGVLTGGPLIVCQLFHICTLGHFGNTDWMQIIAGVGAILTGAVAKDHDVTGGSRPNSK